MGLDELEVAFLGIERGFGTHLGCLDNRWFDLRYTRHMEGMEFGSLQHLTFAMK